ncbi:MAG: flagellar biosynthesis protein FlgB [Acetobacteraceae bacterium]|nr:flagellar biosynthesis protein FlgB [Acetobacteraceae bacterium]
MDPSRLALFDLADRRLAWIGRRQEVLAQNIANADTPGWKTRDLKPFAELLARGGGVAPWQTQPNHLAPRHRADEGRKLAGERAPDGNAVVLDAELGKIADAETAHSLVTGLYSKYLGMFRTVAGR